MPALSEDLTRRLKSEDFLSFAVTTTGLGRSEIAGILADYTAEVATGAQALAGVDLTGKRVLEVGAGIGLLSISLAKAGCLITALEPGANGFDANARLGSAVRTWLGAGDLPVLDIEVGGLDPDLHGRFDVIFSINVLEHIPDLEGAMLAMARVLAPDGVMIHLCPNYTIPFEPHFGLPLLPWIPRLTARLFPEVKDHPVWASLNFVTHGQIRRFTRRAGLVATFRRAMMYDAFVRIDHDEAFSARHSGLVSHLYRALKRTGLLGLLRRLPPGLATPMAFECRFAGQPIENMASGVQPAVDG